MKIISGKVIYLKLTANSEPECAECIPADDKNNGSRAVTKMIITIIMLNVIIRYLNFNEYTPSGIIKERLCYVNNGLLIHFNPVYGAAVKPLLEENNE